MRVWTVTRSTAITAAVALTAACGSGRADDPGPAGPSADDTAAPTETRPADLAELEAIYRARQDSLRQRYTEADVRFVTGMIGHHAQALVMSELAESNGASPVMRVLTGRIINAQRDEIALMTRWLQDRGQPVPDVVVSGVEASIAAAMPGMHMAGMLSPEQLRELAGAHGAEFDRLFLLYMIQHHEGAVTMVHELFAIDGAAQDEAVFKLASDIQVDQITEVERMRLMLEEMQGRAPARERAPRPLWP